MAADGAVGFVIAAGVGADRLVLVLARVLRLPPESESPLALPETGLAADGPTPGLAGAEEAGAAATGGPANAALAAEAVPT